MKTVSWEQLAAWYDAKQGDDGDLWHRALIDPTFLRVVGDVRGLRVLDLGCGNGYLARRYARSGASVVGVDASAPIVDRARAREAREPLGITYHVADAALLPFLGDSSFDLVASNMALMDIEDAEGAIREIGRILVPGGRLAASISHPCFDQGPSSSWLVEGVTGATMAWRKVERYRQPFADETPWSVEGSTVLTIGYHRPLAWYARALRDGGLLIRSLEEPEPTQEFIEGSPQGPFITEIPLHLVIEAVKTETGRSAGTPQRRSTSRSRPGGPDADVRRPGHDRQRCHARNRPPSDGASTIVP